MSKVRLGYALLAVYLVATCVHIGWVVAHEPFSFDAWNVAVDTGAKPGSLSRFFEYWALEYTHSNPRIGQPVAYLVYKFDYVANVLTPLAFLAISAGVTSLGLGRIPRRGRELALWAVATGCLWFALPEIGRNLFCRAYATNYVYTIAVVVWFLVPLRMNAQRWPIAYGVLGVIAGMCNEHTGPALVLLCAGTAWWQRSRGEPFKLAAAGAIGVTIGFAALFLAPGQGERYGGLATKVSLAGRLLQHGVTGNFDILRDWVVYAGPLLVIAVALMLVRASDEARRTRAIRFIGLACAMGLVMIMTLFVSPKLGPRFYMAPMALLLAGVIGLADVVLERPRQICVLVVIAVTASIYAAARTVPLYGKVATQAATRMAALEASQRGDVFVADAWEQVDESWWFIGDDFRDFKKRELVAEYFDLARVQFRGPDGKAPLGLIGAKFIPRYWTADGTTGIDETFDIGYARGFDVEGVDYVTMQSIEILRRRLAPTKVTKVELTVEVTGKPPAFPRPKLLLSRWTEDRFEYHVGKINREGHSTTRTVEPPKEMAGADLDYYIVRVGDEPKKLGPGLDYTPARSGIYWALACSSAECWVIAAARHGGR